MTQLGLVPPLLLHARFTPNHTLYASRKRGARQRTLMTNALGLVSAEADANLPCVRSTISVCKSAYAVSSGERVSLRATPFVGTLPAAVFMITTHLSQSSPADIPISHIRQSSPLHLPSPNITPRTALCITHSPASLPPDRTAGQTFRSGTYI